jgi:ATP-binding cassette subfamily F protein uup
MENLYRKELEWVRAGVQARSTKSKSRLDRFEQLRQSRKKVLEKGMDFSMESSRLGKQVLEWEDLSFGYETPLFSHFSGRLQRRERAGIVGTNGCGKTTLLKILAGQMAPQTGMVKQGQTVKIGWLKQQDLDGDDERSFDWLLRRTNQDPIAIRSMMERFLFDGALQQLPVRLLSGGQKRRLHLIQVLLESPNVLFLDEPTNDLDILTLELLEDYLDTFPGAVLTVCHDRYFLERVCDTFYVFSNGQILTSLDYRIPEAAAAPKKQDSRKPRETNKLTYMEKKELDRLPNQMEDVQNQLNQVNAKAEKAQDFPEMQKLYQLRDELERELGRLEERWLELEEKREMA